jgi:LPPG:FO 2-phospho-L-lactate transferase
LKLPLIGGTKGPPIGHVVLLSGGLGGARLAPALRTALGDRHLTVVANVGDDLMLYGLRICPDVDSVLYALSGNWDAGRGWGRADETFEVDRALGSIGVQRWFSLGDRDLALHLWRTRLLREGQSLTDVTIALADALGVSGVTVLPASDEWAETRVVTAAGSELGFQEWYVRERADPTVVAARIAAGSPSAVVRAALASASAIVFGPSNPIASIGAILGLDSVRELVARIPVRVAVSPIVAGRPMRDSVSARHARARANLLAAQGLCDRPADIASLYSGLVEVFLLDSSDRAAAAAVDTLGLRPVIAELLDAPGLAATLAELVRSATSAANTPHIYMDAREI